MKSVAVALFLPLPPSVVSDDSQSTQLIVIEDRKHRKSHLRLVCVRRFPRSWSRLKHPGLPTQALEQYTVPHCSHFVVKNGIQEKVTNREAMKTDGKDQNTKANKTATTMVTRTNDITPEGPT